MDGTAKSSVISTIKWPTLLLDESRARRNIERMAQKAKASGVHFRPHFKTHQAAEIGDWFRAAGVSTITVSSLRMAEYFAESGWQDIVVAFPVNWLEIDTINHLAQRIRLGLLVEAPGSVQFLTERLIAPVDIWIEADTGYHRTGVAWDAPDQIVALARQIASSSKMRLRGLLTHAGHSYACRSQAEIEAVYHETAARLAAMRETLAQAGFTGLLISLGDTPCCSAVTDLSAVDEIRPGNFVYYDYMQAVIGACSVDDIAVAVACPVVAKHAGRQQIAVYGGGVHLSKDFVVDRQGRKNFGAVALPSAAGWGPVREGSYMASLSQEHGVIQADQVTFDQVAIGSLLMILPAHSCMAADLLKHAVTLSGHTVEMMSLSR